MAHRADLDAWVTPTAVNVELARLRSTSRWPVALADSVPVAYAGTTLHLVGRDVRAGFTADATLLCGSTEAIGPVVWVYLASEETAWHLCAACAACSPRAVGHGRAGAALAALSRSGTAGDPVAALGVLCDCIASPDELRVLARAGLADSATWVARRLEELRRDGVPALSADEVLTPLVAELVVWAADGREPRVLGGGHDGAVSLSRLVAEGWRAWVADDPGRLRRVPDDHEVAHAVAPLLEEMQPQVPLSWLPEQPCHPMRDGEQLARWAAREWRHAAFAAAAEMYRRWAELSQRVMALGDEPTCHVELAPGRLDQAVRLCALWPYRRGGAWAMPPAAALWLVSGVGSCQVRDVRCEDTAVEAALRWWRQQQCRVPLADVLDAARAATA